MRRRRQKLPPRYPRLLRRGAQGRLRSDGRQWPVRVSDGDQDTIMLVLLVDATDLDAQTEALMLECASDHGVTRFQGDAVLEDRDLVRFHVTGSPEVVQRREFVRVRAPQHVLIAFPGDTGIGSAHSVDVSGGGMLLSGADTLDVDDRIRFRLHLEPDSPPIKGMGRVVRSTGDGRRAIVFEQMALEDRERLIHFIFDRQREERAKTRGDSV